MDAKFLTYDVVELAADPAFQAYALDKVDQPAWDTWLASHPEQEQKIKEASQLVQNIRVKPLPKSGIDTAALWDRIDQASPEQKATEAPRKGRRIMLRWVAAAAAGLALLIFFNLGQQGLTTFEAGLAESQSMALPDQSTVQLNADSRISYSKKDWKENRELELNGEAFFQVQKGKKFSVKTPGGTVEVLGTSFNVLARGKEFEVHCKTGRVAVRSGNSEVILNPGDKVSKTEQGALRKGSFDESQEVDWIVGRFRFNNAPLEKVMGSIERQFGYKVDMPQELKATAFTGLYESNNIDSA
ncbi:MAG: hypothetical protein HKN16_10630, partial [Saprospiraceae bacterium]|nr:hypothetical protein [Saprospiraceae bacterium]